MTTNRRSELADGLIAGLNRDPDQRAATQLLYTAAGGIWLSKLDGWPEYPQALQDDRQPDAPWVDWHQLREDLAADDRARTTFNDWTHAYTGRRPTESEYQSHLATGVPLRPWHGPSSSEPALLRIALELAPGGPMGDGSGVEPTITTADVDQRFSTAMRHYPDAVGHHGVGGGGT